MAEGEHVLATHFSWCASLCIHFCGWHMCSFGKVVISIKQNLQKGVLEGQVVFSVYICTSMNGRHIINGLNFFVQKTIYHYYFINPCCYRKLDKH